MQIQLTENRSRTSVNPNPNRKETGTMSTRTLAVAVAIIALAGMATGSAHGALLSVDIGKEFTNTVTPQTGFDSYTDVDPGDNQWTLFNTPVGDSDSGGDADSDPDIEVRINGRYYRSTDSTDPGGSYRQVTNSPIGLNDLLSGSVLLNGGGQNITLELQGLTAGTYRLKTYHHQNYSGGFDDDLGRDMDVYLTDETRTDELLYDEQVVTAGDDLTSMTPTVLETGFSVTGPSQIIELRMHSLSTSGGSAISGTRDMTTLNGFEIVIPEPATFTLFGLGLAMLLGRRRRRRRA